MNSFKSLLKYTLINNLGLNKLKKKRNGNIRSIGVGAMAAIIYVAIMALVVYYMQLFILIFSESTKVEEIYLFVFGACGIACFIATITKANAYIFRTKDYDFLMSLPIKHSVIIATKLISLYLYNLLIVFSLIVGLDIAYAIAIKFDVIYLLYSLLGIIIIPLFPIAISSFIAFLLGFIPLRQKVKNIISIIIYVLLFSGFALVYFIGAAKSGNNVAAIYASIGRYYFVGNWLFEAMTSNNIVSLLLFIAVSIGSFILFIIIVSRFFLKINGVMNHEKKNTNYKLANEKYHKASVTKTLFKKEMRTIFNYPSVLIQLLGGPIMAAIMSIVMTVLYFNQEMMNAFAELDIEFPSLVFYVFLGTGFVFFLTMVSTTASSISLEGKSFWIIKAAPIKTEDVFKAKCLVNIVLMLPVGLICLIAVGIILKVQVIFIILNIIFITSYVLFSTFTGLLLNVKYPRFDYDNPVKAVKQGKPTLFMVLIDFAVIIGVGILMVIGYVTFGLYGALAVGSSIGFILAVLTGYLLTTVGKRNFEAISA